MTGISELEAADRPVRRSLWRRAGRTLRHLPDRLLHVWRRRQALAAMRGRPLPRTVLIVCHGNICRSPYAAAALVRTLPDAVRHSVRVESAGFVGAGRGAPADAITVAARHGLDLSRHRSAPLTHVGVRAADLIMVMDVDQRREILQRFGRRPGDVILLGDLDPAAIDTRTVRDPVEQPLDVFEESYSRIDRCVSVLARALVRLA